MNVPYNYNENEFNRNLKFVLMSGSQKGDRTGTGTKSVFRPPTMRFRLNGGDTFPLLTNKTVNLKAIINELLWFISGDTNINNLDSKIWNEWADETGSIGPMYGHVLRNDGHGGDPLLDTIQGIIDDPNGRRHVISTWRHEHLPIHGLSPVDNVKAGKGALANCHGTMIQFYVNDGMLSLAHYQRSCDLGLGVPFNIASYALLLMMVAKITGLVAHELIFDMGDAHIYSNHNDGVREQLMREPKQSPSIKIRGDQKSILDFKAEDFVLTGYDPHPPIKMAISV